VFNADAMLGISYALTPYAKLTANYRLDYYNNALIAFNSVGGTVNTSRLYQGPNLRLTVRY
jgi:hypothetical protein